MAWSVSCFDIAPPCCFNVEIYTLEATAQGGTLPQDHVDRIIADWEGQFPDVNLRDAAVVMRARRLARFLDREVAAALDPLGLGGGAFDVLAALRRSGPPYALTATALVEALLLTPGAITHRVDNLEREGLVTRTAGAKDRREVLVRLTPGGIALAKRGLTTQAAEGTRLMSALSPTERRTLSGLLRRLLIARERGGRGSAGRGADPASRARQIRSGRSGSNRGR
jgi:DNA-binding MarR family transcriptional regulator